MCHLLVCAIRRHLYTLRLNIIWFSVRLAGGTISSICIDLVHLLMQQFADFCCCHRYCAAIPPAINMYIVYVLLSSYFRLNDGLNVEVTAESSNQQCKNYTIWMCWVLRWNYNNFSLFTFLYTLCVYMCESEETGCLIFFKTCMFFDCHILYLQQISFMRGQFSSFRIYEIDLFASRFTLCSYITIDLDQFFRYFIVLRIVLLMCRITIGS